MTTQSKETERDCKASPSIVPGPLIQRNGVKLADEGSKSKEQRHRDKKERKALRKAAKVAGASLTHSCHQDHVAACSADRAEQVCNQLFDAMIRP